MAPGRPTARLRNPERWPNEGPDDRTAVRPYAVEISFSGRTRYRTACAAGRRTNWPPDLPARSYRYRERRSAGPRPDAERERGTTPGRLAGAPPELAPNRLL